MGYSADKPPSLTPLQREACKFESIEDLKLNDALIALRIKYPESITMMQSAGNVFDVTIFFSYLLNQDVDDFRKFNDAMCKLRCQYNHVERILVYNSFGGHDRFYRYEFIECSNTRYEPGDHEISYSSRKPFEPLKEEQKHNSIHLTAPLREDTRIFYKFQFQAILAVMKNQNPVDIIHAPNFELGIGPRKERYL